MVLSNSKCMQIPLQISRILNTDFQVLFQANSLTRIKIQAILLILQLETDYFSSYSFQNDPFKAVALQSSQRLPELQFYMKRSYRILQFYILQGTHTETFQNPILHPEDKELFDRYYIQRAKRPPFQKRHSTYRRQRDLRVHPFILQDLPKAFQAFQPQDLPRAFQTFQIFQTFQSFMTFSLPGITTHSSTSSTSSIFQCIQGFHPITAFSN